MPKLKYQTYNDIPEWLECPLCGEYSTHYESYFLKHCNICKEYQGHTGDILDYNIDENTTIQDYINQKINSINTTKILIKSNELEEKQNEEYTKILEIIKNRLLENINVYPFIGLDVINIFEFFFGQTEESTKDYLNEMMKWLEKDV